MLPTTGQLPTTEGVIYQVPAGQLARVTFVSVGNESGSDATGEIHIKVGGNTSILLPAITLSDNYVYHLSDIEIYLREGNQILGKSDTASAAQYIISGTEEAL